MGQPSNIRRLHQLARLYGVQTAYYDVHHQRRQASPESLLAVLGALGAPVATLGDVPAAWRERQRALWQRRLEPVTVAWEGGPAAVQVRLASAMAEAALSCCLKLETGEQHCWQCSGADRAVIGAAEVEGTTYLVRQLPLPVRLPLGYHRLTLEVAGRHEESLIMAAPLRAYPPRVEGEKRGWGVFLPLYALHTARSWGAGDFSDLEEFIKWVGERGGNVVATLPLLAAFSNHAYEASPYLPASRLLWNEFYLDVTRAPCLGECPEARAILALSSFQDEVKSLRQAPLVDYPRQMALKRRVLQALSTYFFTQESGHTDLRRFTGAHAVVEDYARFQATVAKQGSPWRLWPQPLRDGVLRDGDYDEESYRYHLFVQWLAHQQMEAVSARAREGGLQMYLDLPLGVHPDGYDVWREREAFMLDVSAGAPPDAVFTTGQNWAFPPLHPERIREQGYRYVIAYLRHHLRHAAILRIDHVMGCHRLFCIPQGREAGQGVYLHYRAEELYALLALESQRHGTVIVGEDLGMVPTYVRPAMKRHGLQRLYVLHYELAANPQEGLHPVSPDAIASLNTHDMPPFASLWEGRDIPEWVALGLMKEEDRPWEEAGRRHTIQALSAFLQQRGWLKEGDKDTLSALRACLSFLADSEAGVVLVNLEDLWLETRPQNIPGIYEQYPSWRRRARYPLEEVGQMPQVLETLRLVSRLRRRGQELEE